MAEMSVIWLRVAAGLYSLGLLHAILMLVRRREHLFRVALGAFALGKSGRGKVGSLNRAVLHFGERHSGAAELPNADGGAIRGYVA